MISLNPGTNHYMLAMNSGTNYYMYAMNSGTNYFMLAMNSDFYYANLVTNEVNGTTIENSLCLKRKKEECIIRKLLRPSRRYPDK